MTYLGDAANNMANSYLLGGATAGMHVRISGPAEYLPRPDIVADAERIAETTGGSVLVTTDPAEACSGADVLVTDTWVSMGQEEEKAARSEIFQALRPRRSRAGARRPGRDSPSLPSGVSGL